MRPYPTSVGLSVLSFLISTTVFAQRDTVLTQPNTTGTFVAPHVIELGPGFSSSGPFEARIDPSLAQCVVMNTALSNNQNYIVVYEPQTAGLTNPADPNNSTCDVKATVNYFDGLGRPLQTVEIKASPTFRDIVTPVAYDSFGRQIKKYSPYTESIANSNGAYKSAALTNQQAFFANPISWNAPGVTATQFPFAEKAFEPSPLNRIVEQGATGDNWQLSTNTQAASPGHTAKLEYYTNDATALTSGSGRWAKLYTVSLDANGKPSLVDQGAYGQTQLYVTVYKNENYKATDGKAGTTEVYTDKEGRVVLKRGFNQTPARLEILSSYFVYDDFGALTYILTPKSEPDNGSITQSVLDNLCYQYRHDERLRQVETKLPGKGVMYKVYNKLDQLVASQDSMQRVQNAWSFIKYDALERPIITGTWNNGGSAKSRISLQADVNAQTVLWENRDNSNTVGKYYSVAAFPTSNIINYLTISYYDDYNIPSLPSTYDVHTSYSSMTRSLLTATLSNVLGTSDMLWTVQYYDDKANPVKVFQQNYFNGTLNVANYDELTSTFDFTQKLISKIRNHHTTGSPLLTIADSTVYDHWGRKIQSWNQINGGSKVLLAKLDYNEVGQLTGKHLHSVSETGPFLQDITYRYNERGWITKDSSSLFVVQLKYNDGTTPMYNGDVANQYWGTGSNLNRSYTYSYDKLNRLTSGNSSESFNEQGIDYDKAGNIQHLTRIDPRYASTSNYTFNYNGNQLTSVAGLTGTNTYLYDGNGNTVFDARNNVNISYNQLNLPQNVTGSKTLSYTYESSGKKLRRVSANSTLGNQDYIEGIQYQNGSVDFITNSEGIARRNPTTGAFSYEYTLTDHLGNNRVCFDDSSHVARVIQRDDYYPFGINYNRYTFGTKNQKLFNGKEYQEELGQYDYGARFYDPVIGRWGTIDPMTEKYYSEGGYNYVGNNPVSRIDPDGQDWDNKSDERYAQKLKKQAAKANEKLEKANAKLQAKIDKVNSGGKTFKNQEAKEKYLAEQTSGIAENNKMIDANKATMGRIDEMTATKEFTYGFDRLPYGSQVGGTTEKQVKVNGVMKDVTVMAVTGDANAVHELTHGYQGTIEKDFSFTTTGALFHGTIAQIYNTEANSEIEAYQAQFAFDSTGFPTSTLTTPGQTITANKIGDINTNFVGGIADPKNSQPLYPWALFKSVVMSLFGNGGH
ncbi:DUF6443 domain-containing protein [Mucilaginibacter sp. RS28]|uniref:DUF6443 domain-containing protein n=1 Tax=Mucilaginibacter straminoryzae TaxID=2932774 RepID=A0A9X1WZM5_9SPHI|nr:DUF6443 domain-containing protein [Mucilaginibacter straminoryzae]MCJ8208076.1 DUF6443 domain-containing protein [Mucilaginibacter straminoryzae]